MTPNLCRGVMAAASPWTWFEHDVKKTNHLHYQSEPVPGIYIIRREGRYLVAMKPQGQKQDNKIFKTDVALNKHEAEVYPEEHLNSCTSWSTNSDASAFIAPSLCTTQSIHSTSSCTSEESVNVVDASRTRKVTFTLPMPKPDRDPYHPSSKTYRKSPLGECHSAADEPVKHSWEYPNHGRHKLFHRFGGDKCPLRSIDIIGFRYLKHPLKVGYSSHIQRWMFSIELEKRTMIADETQGSKQIHMSFKEDKAPKSFTCLDDGRTWILTGDVDKHGKVTQRKGVTRDSGPLYTMISHETLRMLNGDEAAMRRTKLEMNEGMFLRWKGEPEEYARAAKYVPRRKMCS